MCGIVGMVDLRGRRGVDRSLLLAMNESQRHRGPDGDGIFLAPGVGLGHRRLAIIDLTGGKQPLSNEDGSVVVVYNGEIYNYREVLEELRALGHTFRTHCDTEVIVHAWEQWGETCLDRFRGMFAFALWDSRQETLFMARDRLGEKPLNYVLLPDGWLLFASEMKALLRHPGVPRVIDPLAVEEYFAYGYVPDPRTIYRGVHKLPPANKLLIHRGALDVNPRPYWDVAFTGAASCSEEEASDELMQRLKQAVGERLMSEVPLGAFLSGGVDSSAVVATMAGLMTDPVQTCSIGFRQASHDESKYAASVAERYHTRHRLLTVDADDLDLVERLPDIYDEPFGDSSAIPTFRVCALARENVTVALSGDGGDEIFAGYRRYRWYGHEEQVRQLLPSALRRPIFGALAAIYPKADWAPRPLRAKSTLEGIARDSVEGYFHSVCVTPDALRRQLYSNTMRRELQGYGAIQVLDRWMRNAPADDHLSRAQYADLKTYLPGDILTKVDRASMANGLEVRVPLLDHTFVEWAATLPRRLKLRRGEGKLIFKKALEPHLGADVLYRPKMGFAVPLAKWFRGPLRERVRETASSTPLADTGLFDRKTLETLADQHQSGVRDNSSVLWLLMTFDAFLRRNATDEQDRLDWRAARRTAGAAG